MFAKSTAALFGVALGLAGAPALAGDVDTAQRAVFGVEHLDNVTAPTTLHYTFHRRGTLLPDLVDDADLDVLEVRPDGRKQVAFRMFSGEGERRFTPRHGYRNNPMIVAFLQRDVEQMSRMTGGSPHYFRNRIREAFRRDRAVDIEAVTVVVGERQIAGTKVTIAPFVGDPNARRFAAFADKRYEFVMAPEIPGGVYRLRAVTPGTDGTPLLEEAMTFEDDGPDD